MIKYRLITSIILIPMVISALFLLSPVGFTIVTIAVCILSAWEWGKLVGLVSCSQRIQLAVIYGIFLVLMTLTVPTYRSFITVWQARYILWMALAWWLVALLLVLYYPRSAKLWRNSKLLRLVFGVLIILPFCSGMLALRQYNYDINHSTGAWWLLYIMVLVWGMDSGAYIFGHMLGQHKLAPKISPSKTWEGFIGGFFTSIIIAYLFIKYTPLNSIPLIILICSMIAIMAAVLGDLTESMFKREAGIKDTGYLIPGHGGILDRIDSMAAAVPVFTCLMLLVFNDYLSRN